MILWGKVRKGKGRGKGLGYPTANIPLHHNIPQGVYVSLTKIHTVYYPSITFIGNATTFGEKEKKVETYIFSMQKNLYGKWISITLLQKIRGNKKFESVAALIRQMKEDEKKAQQYFQENSIDQ